MTYPSPESHRDAAIARFAERSSKKYDAGQAEHGGRFWRKPVLRYMQDEIVDLVFYYDVLAEQHEVALKYLELARNEFSSGEPIGVFDYICCAENVLRYGNPEGEIETEFNGPKE